MERLWRGLSFVRSTSFSSRGQIQSSLADSSPLPSRSDESITFLLADRPPSIGSRVFDQGPGGLLAMTSTSTVFVVLPAYNESAALRQLIPDIGKTLQSEAIPFKIAIVDDGSVDSTADLL